MLLATALALAYYRDVLNRRLLFKNKPAAVAPKPSPIISSFLDGRRERETVDAAKICGGAENVVKTQQTFVKWLLGFITLIVLLAGSVCIIQ